MRGSRWGAGWLLLPALCLAHAVGANPPLRVCLEANGAPFSSEARPDHGIDHAVAARVAGALGRPPHRFALYRARVPTTRLQASGYRHVLGVNTGFAGIAPALLREVDRALEDLMATGRIAAAGLCYTAPGSPAVLPALTPRLLARREAFAAVR